jgi:hypothetical protein
MGYAAAIHLINVWRTCQLKRFEQRLSLQFGLKRIAKTIDRSKDRLFAARAD